MMRGRIGGGGDGAGSPCLLQGVLAAMGPTSGSPPSLLLPAFGSGTSNAGSGGQAATGIGVGGECVMSPMSAVKDSGGGGGGSFTSRSATPRKVRGTSCDVPYRDVGSKGLRSYWEAADGSDGSSSRNWLQWCQLRRREVLQLLPFEGCPRSLPPSARDPAGITMVIFPPLNSRLPVCPPGHLCVI